jgi:hypothetical protein
MQSSGVACVPMIGGTSKPQRAHMRLGTASLALGGFRFGFVTRMQLAQRHFKPPQLTDQQLRLPKPALVIDSYGCVAAKPPNRQDLQIPKPLPLV